METSMYVRFPIFPKSVLPVRKQLICCQRSENYPSESEFSFLVPTSVPSKSDVPSTGSDLNLNDRKLLSLPIVVSVGNQVKKMESQIKSIQDFLNQEGTKYVDWSMQHIKSRFILKAVIFCGQALSMAMGAFDPGKELLKLGAHLVMSKVDTNEKSEVLQITDLAYSIPMSAFVSQIGGPLKWKFSSTPFGCFVFSYMAIRAHSKMMSKLGDSYMGEFQKEKHVNHLKLVLGEDVLNSLNQTSRLRCLYMGLNALDILGCLNHYRESEVIPLVLNCQHESGGFGGGSNSVPNVLSTLHAIQILSIYDKLDVINVDKVCIYIASLQDEDGGFAGFLGGMVDVRFSYWALCALSLLDQLKKINLPKALSFILSCRSEDSGFSSRPGGDPDLESVFCCVGSLVIARSLHLVNKDAIAFWCSKHHVSSGGFSSHPGMIPDVSCSWLALCTMIMVQRVEWIEREKNSLTKFILNCQDKEHGGFSNKPGEVAALLQSFYGISCLALLMTYPGLKKVSASYGLTQDILCRIIGLI